MACTEIKFDEKKLFYSTIMPVMINHINYGKHVGHDSFLTILQEARMRFLKQYNMSEIAIYKSIGIIVTGVCIKYISESFYGDDLEVKMGINIVNKISCDFIYKINNTATNKTVAKAKIETVFYDYNNKKISSMPPEFLEILQKINSSAKSSNLIHPQS